MSLFGGNKLILFFSFSVAIRCDGLRGINGYMVMDRNGWSSNRWTRLRPRQCSPIRPQTAKRPASTQQVSLLRVCFGQIDIFSCYHEFCCCRNCLPVREEEEEAEEEEKPWPDTVKHCVLSIFHFFPRV